MEHKKKTEARRGNGFLSPPRHCCRTGFTGATTQPTPSIKLVLKITKSLHAVFAQKLLLDKKQLIKFTFHLTHFLKLLALVCYAAPCRF